MFENCKKSQYPTGYDSKFKEPETVEILEIAKDAIIAGYKKNTLAKLLCNELDMKYVYAQALAAKAWREVMQTGKDRTEGMKEKNIRQSRLRKVSTSIKMITLALRVSCIIPFMSGS